MICIKQLKYSEAVHTGPNCSVKPIS